MSDRRIDPTTGDFVSAAKGGFATSDDIENQVAFSFLVERGSWEGDPELGHRFAELAREVDTQANRRRFADLAVDAVRWLIDAGKLDHVDVTVESWGAGIVVFQIDYFTPGTPAPRKAGPFLVATGAG